MVVLRLLRALSKRSDNVQGVPNNNSFKDFCYVSRNVLKNYTLSLNKSIYNTRIILLYEWSRVKML